MLSCWTISNFKSFRELPPISLSQITVLAGANSSGKSSIIQSILLLKQTLQYGPQNRTLTLNGPLLRLGSFDDIRNFNARDEPIVFGFEFSLPKQDLVYRDQTWMRTAAHQLSDSEFGVATKLRFVGSYEPQREDADHSANHAIQSNVLPFLTSMKFSIDRKAETEVQITQEATYNRNSDLLVDLSQAVISDYSVELDERSQEEIFSGKYSPSISSAWLSQFLPSWIFVKHDVAKQRAHAIIDSIFRANASFLTDSRYAEELVPTTVVNRVNQWLEINSMSTIEPGDSGARVSQLRRALPKLGRTTTGLASLLPLPKKYEGLLELREELLALMLEASGSQMDLQAQTPRSIGAASQLLREYFKHGVRYLGPLRDGPRPVYQLEALESSTDVGYRGEHTAAVLELNSRTNITFRSPPTQEADISYDLRSVFKTLCLRDAVVEWLVYLGVADGVKTTDAGVFGNRLQVSTDSAGKLHDLTNVGVGVSQVLPIVVMSLLAPRGAFLIFEQPELHLHPRVQAKLADFFLSLALDDKQVLLETHSEYLVDRFRLRIAQSENKDFKKLLGVYFTEKSHGESNITPIEINEYGTIVNWPKDFFEQAQKEGSQIIQAATKKRRSHSPPKN